MKTITLIITLFLSIELLAQSVGETAPAFTLESLDGASVSLSDYANKTVLLFFLGYGCPYCKSATPTIKSEIIDAFGGTGNVVVLGIDTWNGNTAELMGFRTSTGVDDIVYLKNGSTVGTTYNTSYDRLIVVGKNGTIIYKGSTGASATISAAKAAIENDQQTATDLVSLEETSGFILGQNSPNPASDKTIIPFQSPFSTEIVFSVYTIYGKLLYSETMFVAEGKENIYLNVSGYPKGIYFYKVSVKGEEFVKQLLVK